MLCSTSNVNFLHLPNSTVRKLRHEHQAFVYLVPVGRTRSTRSLQGSRRMRCTKITTEVRALGGNAFFMSCGIYNGENCPLFCHALQAQYWTRRRLRRRCFRFSPSLTVLKRIYAYCMHRCAHAKKRIRQYRIDGLERLGSDASRFGWKTSNIKALIYLSVNRRGFVKSRLLVYTSNPWVPCATNINGTYSCRHVLKQPYNKCTCSACTVYRAYCPSCCRSKGYLWA